MIDFNEKFTTLSSEIVGAQKKLDNIKGTELQVYYGINIGGYYRLSFRSESIPVEIESTKVLLVTQEKESDKIYWTNFDLLDKLSKNVFYELCNDLLSAIVDINDEKKEISALKNRFYAWRTMFTKQQIMSVEKIQGLFGELYFLMKYMVPKYGISKSVNAWTGPDGGVKDFSISNDWYEVKTISVSVLVIKISSLNQLSSKNPGQLVIIRVEKMSNNYKGTKLSSINDLFSEIIKLINNDHIKELFLTKLFQIGYNMSEEIDKIRFRVDEMSHYIVNNKFPKIQEKDVIYPEIGKIQYELIINSLMKYKVEV